MPTIQIMSFLYVGGLKSQCENENYLIFWDKPFLFFNIVSF